MKFCPCLFRMEKEDMFMIRRKPLEHGVFEDIEIARRYDKEARIRMRYVSKSFVSVVRKWGITSGKVLDVGTGTGLLAIEFAKPLPGPFCQQTERRRQRGCRDPGLAGFRPGLWLPRPAGPRYPLCHLRERCRRVGKNARTQTRNEYEQVTFERRMSCPTRRFFS